MNALQVFRYNDTSIEFETIDGQLYANASAMCQANGKRVNDWKELASTKRYVAALEAKPEITVSLIISRKGGSIAGGTTWIHEKLILKLAAWLDVQFEIWCDEIVSGVLRTGQVQLKPMTQGEMNLQLAQSFLDLERRQMQLEETVKQIDARTQTRPDYFTVAGYANLNHISIGLKAASSVGQKASRICKERGLMMESTPDPRFGQVNMYPSTVLKEVFSQPIQ